MRRERERDWKSPQPVGNHSAVGYGFLKSIMFLSKDLKQPQG